MPKTQMGSSYILLKESRPLATKSNFSLGGGALTLLSKVASYQSTSLKLVVPHLESKILVEQYSKRLNC